MLIFSKGSVDSLKAIDSVLDQLATNTGLAINKSKSKIFFSRGCNNKDALKEAIGIVEGRMPTKYLGIPLSVTGSVHVCEPHTHTIRGSIPH